MRQEPSMKTSRSAVLASAFVIAAALAGMSTTAFAASGGGGSSGGAPTHTCKAGTAWDQKKGTCVKTSMIDDGQLYADGRDLALAGQYQVALDTLNAIQNKNDSMVLTMIGYSTRKLGNYDEGLNFYNQALVLNPNNANTREYLGEAYAEKGKIELAQAELVKVSAICGTDCEQYRDLAAAIAGKPDND